MNNSRDSTNESILSKLGNHYNEQFSKQALEETNRDAIVFI